MKFDDITGRIFGRLTILEFFGRDKNGIGRWKAICECGNIRIVKRSSLVKGRTKSCGCYNRDKGYKGSKDISGSYFCRLIKQANIRKIEFDLTIEYLQQLLETQNYKCALSGIKIQCSRNPDNKKWKTYLEQTASVDRIDSSKGYIIGNIQWVHKDINYMKQDLSDEEFIKWCGLVFNNRIKK